MLLFLVYGSTSRTPGSILACPFHKILMAKMMFSSLKQTPDKVFSSKCFKLAELYFFCFSLANDLPQLTPLYPLCKKFEFFPSKHLTEEKFLGSLNAICVKKKLTLMRQN